VVVVASLSQGRAAAAQCGLFTYKSVPVIFEPPCTIKFVISILPKFLCGIVWVLGAPINVVRHKNIS